MEGLMMQLDGSFAMAKQYGPPSFDSWMEGWTVFRTGAVMLGQLTPATCDLWAKTVGAYNKTYGSKLWPLIYQAEVRGRVEQLERVRRRGAKEHAKASPGTHDYDPAKPWEWSFRATAEDEKFWKAELEQKALKILTKMSEVSETLGGDAVVARSSAQSERVVAAVNGLPPPRAEKAPREKPPPAERLHKVDAEGYATHNRNGIELCSGWQEGTCFLTKWGNRCSKDVNKAHQCSRCLDQCHGRKFPKDCDSNMITEPKSKKGKSKGGKSGGKGKKRNQHQW